MSLYEPPQVNVDTGGDPSPGWQAILAAVGIPWLLTVAALYFLTPVLTQGLVATLEDGTDAHLNALLGFDLALDTVFVAIGAYLAIQLSGLPRLSTALLFGVSLVAVHTVEVGGLPGVIDTGLPLWYELAGNVNDIAGALLAVAVHGWNAALDA